MKKNNLNLYLNWKKNLNNIIDINLNHESLCIIKLNNGISNFLVKAGRKKYVVRTQKNCVDMSVEIVNTNGESVRFYFQKKYKDGKDIGYYYSNEKVAEFRFIDAKFVNNSFKIKDALAQIEYLKTELPYEFRTI